MKENTPSTREEWSDEDDAPDLSTPEYQQKFAGVPVRRGRPKSENAKILTTLRIDPDIVAYFKAGGDGWQTRINEALRSSMAPPKARRTKSSP